MSSGVEVAERLRENAQYLRDGCDNVGHYAEMADQLDAAASEIERLLERLEAAERKAMLPDLAVCSWCGEFHDGDPDGASDCCMCDLVPYSDLPSIIKDARREVAEEAKTHEAEEAAAEARVAVLEQERDDYLTRLNEVNVARQQNEVRAVVLREALQRIEWIWDEDANANRCPSCGLLEGRGLYFGGHDRSCSLGAALAVDGTPDSQTDSGDDAERRPSGGKA